jgi:hypothetical protein
MGKGLWMPLAQIFEPHQRIHRGGAEDAEKDISYQYHSNLQSEISNRQKEKAVGLLVFFMA